jgi:hypothetical protein
MADAVRDNEMSVIKIALAEKEKRESEEIYKKAEGSNSSKVFLIFGGIILIVIALGITYFVTQKNVETTSPVQTIKEIEAPISFNEKTFVDTAGLTTHNDLSGAIKKEVGNDSKENSVKAIFLKKDVSGKPELVNVTEFISLIGESAPQALIRNLGEKYLIGTYNTKDGDSSKPHLFLIFSIKDYNQTYASMLSWEKTMLNDMSSIFGIDISGDRSELLEKQWSDIIIDNKDARVLYDNLGKEVLYYIFINKNNFIIADNQDVLKEVVTRIISKETKPL